MDTVLVVENHLFIQRHGRIGIFELFVIYLCRIEQCLIHIDTISIIVYYLLVVLQSKVILFLFFIQPAYAKQGNILNALGLVVCQYVLIGIKCFGPFVLV